MSEPSKIDEPNCNACGVAMDRNNRCDFEMPTPERWAQVCIGCIQLDRGDVVYRVRVARKAAEQETPMHEYKVGDRVELRDAFSDGSVCATVVGYRDVGDGVRWLLTRRDDGRKGGGEDGAFISNHCDPRPIPCEACGEENACVSPPSEGRTGPVNAWRTEEIVDALPQLDGMGDVNLGPACWRRACLELADMVHARRTARGRSATEVFDDAMRPGSREWAEAACYGDTLTIESGGRPVRVVADPNAGGAPILVNSSKLIDSIKRFGMGVAADQAKDDRVPIPCCGVLNRQDATMTLHKDDCPKLAAVGGAALKLTPSKTPGYPTVEVDRGELAARYPKPSEPPEPTLADFEELCAIHLGAPDAPEELPKGWRYVTDRCSAKNGGEAGRLLTVLDEKGATVGDIFYADSQDPHEVGRDLGEVVTYCATIYTRRSHSGPGRGRRR